jgi:hypothetical protein
VRSERAFAVSDGIGRHADHGRCLVVSVAYLSTSLQRTSEGTPSTSNAARSVWKMNDVSDVTPSAPRPVSNGLSPATAPFSSSRPIRYQPLADADPLSVIRIASRDTRKRASLTGNKRSLVRSLDTLSDDPTSVERGLSQHAASGTVFPAPRADRALLAVEPESISPSGWAPSRIPKTLFPAQFGATPARTTMGTIK